MITLADRESERRIFLDLCEGDPLFGPVLSTQAACYFGKPFALFWVIWAGSRPAGILSRVMGECTLFCPEQALWEELGEFLALLPWRSLKGEAGLAAFLASRLGGRAFSAPAMVYAPEPGAPPPALSPDIREEREDFRDIFRLQCRADEAFARTASLDEWLAGLAGGLNRGLCRACVLPAGGRPAAVGMIAYQSRSAALLANIAVEPSLQGQGLGSRMVRHLTALSLQEGRLPSLLCGGEELPAFYRPLGFQHWGRWGALEQNEQ